MLQMGLSEDVTQNEPWSMVNKIWSAFQIRVRKYYFDFCQGTVKNG